MPPSSVPVFRFAAQVERVITEEVFTVQQQVLKDENMCGLAYALHSLAMSATPPGQQCEPGGNRQEPLAKTLLDTNSRNSKRILNSEKYDYSVITIR